MTFGYGMGMDKWDRIWTERGHAVSGHAAFLDRIADRLPTRGRALDLAGGAGRNATWLAARGFDVTVCDRSAVGLTLAAEAGHKTLQRDVEAEGPPEGPWDLVLIHHFLWRPVFDLLDTDWLIFVQPTTINLERHPRPSERFLLRPGEVVELLAGQTVVHLEEGWGAEGRHEARVVARTPPEEPKRRPRRAR